MGEMRTMDTITIPAPAADHGDKVSVLNYRLKPEQWESGKVVDVLYRPAYTGTRYDNSTYQIGGQWTYEVWITRERNGGYRITVSDGKIRRLR